MEDQLKGKIIWIDDDLNYNGIVNNKEHTVSTIENIVIDDGMIKFFVDGKNYLDRSFYSVNLIGDGTTYTNYLGEDITIKCDLLINKDKYHLYGSWIEEGINYTWWAIVFKNKSA